MKVYLAAPYAARELIGSYADDLRDLGIEITSTWLSETQEIKEGTLGPAKELSDREVENHVQQDLIDIRGSDVFVVFTSRAAGVTLAQAASGGRLVEMGYAMAYGIPVIVVGEPENIFQRHQTSFLTVVSSWRKALVGLAVHQREL